MPLLAASVHIKLQQNMNEWADSPLLGRDSKEKKLPSTFLLAAPVQTEKNPEDMYSRTVCLQSLFSPVFRVCRSSHLSIKSLGLFPLCVTISFALFGHSRTGLDVQRL